MSDAAEHRGRNEVPAPHTPGPWLIEHNRKSASVSVFGKRGDGNVRQSDGLGCLVTVDCALEPDAVMFSPFNLEDVAIAHLIAAAPEMLAALQRVEILMTNLGAKGEPLTVRAAIAKARGTS